MHIEMKMKGILQENTGKLIHMKGTWKENERKVKGNEYTMKGRRMQKWKEHEVLPKHLKPTKQLLNHESISEPV